MPQGRHVHVLLLRGRLILDRLFPGLSDELRADGAVLANLGRDLGWHHAGGWRVRFDSDLSFLAMSRPLLEFRVAERVRALPNAAVRDGVRVDRLHKDGRNTVAGVRLTSRAPRIGLRRSGAISWSTPQAAGAQLRDGSPNRALLRRGRIFCRRGSPMQHACSRAAPSPRSV